MSHFHLIPNQSPELEKKVEEDHGKLRYVIYIYKIMKWDSRLAIKQCSDDSFNFNQVISIQQFTIYY